MTAPRARQTTRSRKPAPAPPRSKSRRSASARKSPTTKKRARAKTAPAAAKRTTARRRGPGRLRRILTGDRVYVFVFMGVVAALVAMAINPVQNLTAAEDRVEDLTETRDVLREEVDRLEERRERLHDPEEVELMARAHLGLVMPGEVPFVVVTPEEELDRVHPEGPGDTGESDSSPEQDDPWYRQIGRWLGDLVP